MTAEKDVQVARKKGRGGEVIWAMPERKHSFLHEVFPYFTFYMSTLLAIFTNLLALFRLPWCKKHKGAIQSNLNLHFAEPFTVENYLSESRMVR